jgi:hypothetical protein
MAKSHLDQEGVRRAPPTTAAVQLQDSWTVIQMETRLLSDPPVAAVMASVLGHMGLSVLFTT